VKGLLRIETLATSEEIVETPGPHNDRRHSTFCGFSSAVCLVPWLTLIFCIRANRARGLIDSTRMEYAGTAAGHHICYDSLSRHTPHIVLRQPIGSGRNAKTWVANPTPMASLIQLRHRALLRRPPVRSTLDGMRECVAQLAERRT
jgi:hypothetical protein